LIADDLPAFERPTNATSGTVPSTGSWTSFATVVANRAVNRIEATAAKLDPVRRSE
jgi:hypothetical protein